MKESCSALHFWSLYFIHFSFDIFLFAQKSLNFAHSPLRNGFSLINGKLQSLTSDSSAFSSANRWQQLNEEDEWEFGLARGRHLRWPRPTRSKTTPRARAREGKKRRDCQMEVAWFSLLGSCAHNCLFPSLSSFCLALRRSCGSSSPSKWAKSCARARWCWSSAAATPAERPSSSSRPMRAPLTSPLDMHSLLESTDTPGRSPSAWPRRRSRAGPRSSPSSRWETSCPRPSCVWLHCSFLSGGELQPRHAYALQCGH